MKQKETSNVNRVMDRMLEMSVGGTTVLWGVTITRHGRDRFEVGTIDGRNAKDLLGAALDLLNHSDCWLKTNWED